MALAVLLQASALSAAGADSDCPASILNEGYTCPAPAPTGVHETDVTPTSISLAWNPVFSAFAIYYQVEGYDLTTSNSLPSYITTNNNFTYSGLTAGHSYQFQVSASYCSNGPFGTHSAPANVRIPEIVIDNIVQLQSPCTPGNARATYNGASFSFCVQQSSVAEPYSTGVVGAIGSYQFAVAYYNGEIQIGDLNSDNTGYYFSPVNASEVICYQEAGNTDIALFSIKHNNGTVALPGLSIRFFTNCGNFTSCGSPCGMSENQSDRNDIGTGLPASDPAGMVAPNPFTESAIFRYTLVEESPVEIGLYDAPGRLLLLLETAPGQPGGQYELVIRGEGLPAGIYYLHSKIGQQQKTYVMVKTE